MRSKRYPKTIGEKKAMKAFERMREDAARSGLQGMSLDEINSIIRDVRNGH